MVPRTPRLLYDTRDRFDTMEEGGGRRVGGGYRFDIPRLGIDRGGTSPCPCASAEQDSDAVSMGTRRGRATVNQSQAWLKS